MKKKVEYPHSRLEFRTDGVTLRVDIDADHYYVRKMSWLEFKETEIQFMWEGIERRYVTNV